MKENDGGKQFNVMKNVSTHSMINANDGELQLRLEIEDIGKKKKKKRLISISINLQFSILESLRLQRNFQIIQIYIHM